MLCCCCALCCAVLCCAVLCCACTCACVLEQKVLEPEDTTDEISPALAAQARAQARAQNAPNANPSKRTRAHSRGSLMLRVRTPTSRSNTSRNNNGNGLRRRSSVVKATVIPKLDVEGYIQNIELAPSEGDKMTAAMRGSQKHAFLTTWDPNPRSVCRCWWLYSRMLTWPGWWVLLCPVLSCAVPCCVVLCCACCAVVLH